MGCMSSTPVASGSLRGPSADLSQFSDLKRCFHDGYRLGTKLGKGGFSQVRSAKKTASADSIEGGEWAVKIIDLRKQQVSTNAFENSSPRTDATHAKIDPVLRREALCEASVWIQAGNSKFIVPLADAFMDASLAYFVMEKCDLSLRAFLEQGAGAPMLDEGGLTRVFSDMLMATSHVHSLGIVHRDIKPDNFLAKDGVVKMCDFGLSEVLPPQSRGLSGTFGTAPFMSPEMLKGIKYGEKTDTWSLGALAYVLLFGEFPYTPVERKASAMKRCIRDGKQEVPFVPYRVVTGAVASEAATNFVRALLVRDPNLRASADEALQMPLFTQPREGEAAPMHLMLGGAVKAGAFENRRTDGRDTADGLLAVLQQKHQSANLDSPYSSATTADSLGQNGDRSPQSDCSTGISSSNGGSSNAVSLRIVH